MAMPKQLRALTDAGQAKRGDSLRVLWSAIQHEEGFNVDGRLDDCEENRALEQYIFDGGEFPPIWVRLDDDGNVKLVEGHRRHHFYGKARERGAPLDEYMNVLLYKGNDADRVAAIATSNSQLALTPLQLAQVYLRLSRMGKNPSEIARMVNKSSVHVSKTLKLAYANSDVHKMVKEGRVSATAAIRAVEAHGEKAAAVLVEPKLDRAQKIDVLEDVTRLIRAAEDGRQAEGKSELGQRLAKLLWSKGDAEQ